MNLNLIDTPLKSMLVKLNKYYFESTMRADESHGKYRIRTMWRGENKKDTKITKVGLHQVGDTLSESFGVVGQLDEWSKRSWASQ